MSEFTPGKWWIAPPIFDGDVIFAPAQEKGRRNEVVAMGILNNADARLIAAAPEMYELLQSLISVLAVHSYSQSEAVKIYKLLARIDGTEDYIHAEKEEN